MHTFDVLEHVRAAGNALINQETGFRGYLLSADESFLEPYHEGTNTYDFSFAKAKELTADNPVQQARLDDMNRLASAWRNSAESAISLMTRPGGREDAQQWEIGYAGKGLMDTFRAKVNEIIATEQSLMELRRYERKAAFFGAYAMAIGGGALLFALSFLVACLLHWDVSRPVIAMTDAMRRLAGGDLMVQIPGVDRVDEIGSMAEAVKIFRGSLIEADLRRSEQSAAQQQVERYAVELERSNRELDEFAYVASHDLKAPLRVINNAARWLEEDLAEHLSADDKVTMTMLRNRAQRMEKLLDDLLEYSRVGHVSDRRFVEVVNGRVLMDDILLLLSPPPSFEVRVAPGFEHIQVSRMPLQQVIYNLIGNAIKHHDKQAGLIEVGVEDAGAFLRFTVRDDGPGIPERFHEQAFKMFQTLKSRDQVEGSGMGLAFVKKTVGYFGGEVSLASAVGEGATFSFTWPKQQKMVGELQWKAA